MKTYEFLLNLYYDQLVNQFQNDDNELSMAILLS